MFLITFLELLFKKSSVMSERLWQALSLLSMCFIIIFFLYYQHGQHVKKVTIIESSSGMKQSDPPKRSFICFGPLSSFFKDHHVGPLLRLSIPIG